ncbi:Ubiquitin thioesterase otubain-like [Ananas comosus]|uniref:Ubiquitin thioesterase otubain-like n=1 Tax=Ananas comosus TaxID=4615 RepID=A0A199V5S8_ANACO|nr:Ubiquitin thioesterase otubain-like [Ananas comosus]
MNAILGGHEYTFDELSQELQHVLERIIHAAPNSTSPDEFLLNCLDEHASLNGELMIFFRLVTSIEIHMNSNYYRPKIHAEYRSMEEFVLEQAMIVDFETDQLRVKALSEALEIPTKVVQFDVLAPVPELPKLPYCFFDGSSRRNFNLGLLSDDFLLISGSSDEHAVPATGPPSPAILDLRAPSYVTLVFWRGHYGVLYRNSVLSGLKHDFF